MAVRSRVPGCDRVSADRTLLPKAASRGSDCKRFLRFMECLVSKLGNRAGIVHRVPNIAASRDIVK